MKAPLGQELVERGVAADAENLCSLPSADELAFGPGTTVDADNLHVKDGL
jgi:hypothetical protein